ncbi:MAG: homoserine kinase [bacterium]|nr:homoserine kinase [bacterium]
MIKKIYVKVPASIGNMGSGFDCAGLSLKLYNGFIVERAKKTEMEFSKSFEDVSSKKILLLFLKAFNSTLKTNGKDVFPVKVNMENNIPFKRGFGSSATLIIAGIISAFLFIEQKIKKEDILKIALPIEGHIDNIAASLYGGFAIGKVDTLKVISVKPPDNLRVIAFIPAKGLSTKIAREVLPQSISVSDIVYNLSSMAFLCAAFFLKKLDLLKLGLDDKLHQPYRVKVIPHLKTFLVDKKPLSVLGGCLSGAGPSIVFFTESEKTQKVISDVKTIIRKENLKGEVFLLYPGGKTSWKVVE